MDLLQPDHEHRAVRFAQDGRPHLDDVVRPDGEEEPIKRGVMELAQGDAVPDDRLAEATPAERDHWTIGPRGISVHWPDVDEDIAIWEVLGIAEDAYLRWLQESPVS